MKTPVATYRIQFHKDFTFEQLESIIDYLHELGISTIYASPITGAAEDSVHGYDVTDPHSCNPAIGTVDILRRIAGKLKERQMSWLQDIVPNHMAFRSGNGRLMDVLERGHLSPFHIYFDIDDRHPAFPGKLMAPFLAEEPAMGIQKKEIQLVLAEQGIWISFPGDAYPLSLSAYHLLFIDMMARDTPMHLPPPLTQLAFTSLQERSYTQWQELKQAVFNEIYHSPPYRQQVETWLQVVNNRSAWLMEILDRQYYRLTDWQQVNQVINYRRFFTISSLIGLQMEQEPVFNDYHAFLHQLYEDGLIQGLRIDHIDGLYDPGDYIGRLRTLFGPDCYIVAEKILEEGEQLPADWALQGTSGYEFLAAVNQLYSDAAGRGRLDECYRRLVPDGGDYRREVIKNKQLILESYMGGELDNLVRLFFDSRLQQHDDRERWRTALCALMVHLPVYRVYFDQYPLPEMTRRVLLEAFMAAKNHIPSLGPELGYLQRLWMDDPGNGERRTALIHFGKRLMQFTGPLMAKGVEDTTFYVYNASIAQCEVGDSPAVKGLPVVDFHAAMQRRLHTMPLSLNATATHDTKRGEDARMRLNMLSRIPAAWEQAVGEWMKMNEPLKRAVNGRMAPGRNEEYFIYQSLLAGFPADLFCTPDFVDRLVACIVKALREAKVNTNWEAPDTAYEEACEQFIRKMLASDHSFLPLFRPLARQVIEGAVLFSLGQVLIKLTAPGIPDIYQGSELWNVSFVDPDNRRPVDYQKAACYLQQLRQQDTKGVRSLLAYLQQHRSEGLEKLYITWKTLQFRQAHPALFSEGRYYPIPVAGDAVLMYARQWRNRWAVVIAPLDPRREEVSEPTPLVLLPAEAPAVFKNIFTGREIRTQARGLSWKDAMTGFPVALLVNEE